MEVPCLTGESRKKMSQGESHERRVQKKGSKMSREAWLIKKKHSTWSEEHKEAGCEEGKRYGKENEPLFLQTEKRKGKLNQKTQKKKTNQTQRMRKRISC